MFYYLKTGDLIPRHMHIFKTNEFFAGITLPKPETMEPLQDKIPKIVQTDPNVFDFLLVSDFKNTTLIKLKIIS